jgi:hypothetical protein
MIVVRAVEGVCLFVDFLKGEVDAGRVKLAIGRICA